MTLVQVPGERIGDGTLCHRVRSFPVECCIRDYHQGCIRHQEGLLPPPVGRHDHGRRHKFRTGRLVYCVFSKCGI